MRLLLDTHVWLWSLTEPARLRADLRDLLQSGEVPVFLSAASAWEIAIKYRLGKLPLPEPPREFVARRLVRDGISPLAVEMHHAVEVAKLPDHHNDPFDRVLIAQAQLEHLTLVTADEKLRRYEVALLLT